MIGTINNTPSGLKTHAEARAGAWAYIQGRRNGTIKSLISPWKKYNDAHVDGFEWRRIVLIAGGSGSGKSAIGNQLEKEIHDLNSNEDFIIVNFNYEMPSEDIIIRNTIAELNISNKELLSAEGIMLSDEMYNQAKKFLAPGGENTSIFYCEYPKTATQYYKLCHAYYEKYKKKLLIMTDHSILFEKAASESSMFDTIHSVAKISIQLKKEIPCIQIHFSQLNNEIEDPKRRIKKSSLNYPSKSDIYGGAPLYNASDTVLVNHRPFLLDFPMNSYGPDGLPTSSTDLYWHFLKLRQGSPHIAHMRADFAHMKIYDN